MLNVKILYQDNNEIFDTVLQIKKKTQTKIRNTSLTSPNFFVTYTFKMVRFLFCFIFILNKSI